jgi:2-methylcitrate dehydratase PrpD
VTDSARPFVLELRYGLLESTNMQRRQALHSIGGLMAAAALRPRTAPAVAQESSRATTEITGRLARYMVAARSNELPSEVSMAAKHRILDTLGAIVSGAQLKAGEMAIQYVRTQGGTPEALIPATDIRTSAVNAAFACGMFAHADETDDFEPVTKAHPGCVVVPSALSMGEREDRSGEDMLRAVTLGYDLCCRLLMALGPDHVRATHRSAEGVSSTFGAVGAAASLARLDEKGMRYALSYAAQQVSGVWSWERDLEHVEKAFDFSGMGARNGVTAAILAQSGFTGVPDVLDGEHNALIALSREPKPEEMVAGLGKRFFVTETAIKVFSVGYPIQAPLDAFMTLRRQHGLTVNNVERIVARLPEDGARIVDDRAMPDVNLQYAMAVALIDGTLSFDASHSYERMQDSQVQAVKKRIELIADRALMDPTAPRSGRVDVTMRDGRTFTQFTKYPPGTKENPLNTATVTAKARELMLPVIGANRTDAVIDRVNNLEKLRSVRELMGLLGQT